MHQEQKIKAIRDLIQSANTSIQSAKKILDGIIGDEFDDELDMDMHGLSSYHS
jgi:hypothetical protein